MLEMLMALFLIVMLIIIITTMLIRDITINSSLINGEFKKYFLIFSILIITLLVSPFIYDKYLDITSDINSQHYYEKLSYYVDKNDTYQVHKLIEKGVNPWVEINGKNKFIYSTKECNSGTFGHGAGGGGLLLLFLGGGRNRCYQVYEYYPLDKLIKKSIENDNIEMTKYLLLKSEGAVIKFKDNEKMPPVELWSDTKIDIFSIYKSIIYLSEYHKYIDIILDDPRIKLDENFVQDAIYCTPILKQILNHYKLKLTNLNINNLLTRLNDGSYNIENTKMLLNVKALESIELRVVERAKPKIKNIIFDLDKLNLDTNHVNEFFVDILKNKNYNKDHFLSLTYKIIKYIDPTYNNDEPIVLAAQHGFYDIVEMLINTKTIKTINVESYIHDKKIQEDDFLKTLKVLEPKIDFSVNNNQLLINCCEKGLLEVVKYLISDIGIDPKIRYNLPITKARENKNWDISDYLETYY